MLEYCFIFDRRAISNDNDDGGRVLDVGARDVNGSLRSYIESIVNAEHAGNAGAVVATFFYKINEIAAYTALDLTRYVYLMAAAAALVGTGLLLKLPWQAAASLIAAMYLLYYCLTEREPWRPILRFVAGER